MKTGRRFTDNIRSKSSTLVSVIGEKQLIPALLITMSISPHSLKICCIQFSSASRSLTSTWKKEVPVCNAVSFPAASFRSQNATRCPAERKAFTIALPMPSAPPVTKTLLVLWITAAFLPLPAFAPEDLRDLYSSYFFSR